LAGFPDNSNSRDLVQRKYQIQTDMTDTVGKVMLGQTVECARCHNHKFDKISQKDYFSLQSFFANTSAVDNIPSYI
jgi:cytochrome c